MNLMKNLCPTLLIAMLLSCANAEKHEDYWPKHRFSQAGYLDASGDGVLLYDDLKSVESDDYGRCYDLEVNLTKFRSVLDIPRGTKVFVRGDIGNQIPVPPNGGTFEVLLKKDVIRSLDCRRRQLVKLKSIRQMSH